LKPMQTRNALSYWFRRCVQKKVLDFEMDRGWRCSTFDRTMED
jgi:hypothetical protein